MPTTYYYTTDNIRYDMGIMIDDRAVPDPASMDWGHQDISTHDAGRDESGTMHTMKITSKRTMDIAWNMIDPVNTKDIIGKVTAGQNIYCTLPDPETAELRRSLYYVGDIKVSYEQWMNAPRIDGKLYSKLSFTLIEV